MTLHSIRRHLIIAALALTAILPSATNAQVAGRPITIIVPYSPGTGIDILARALGAELSQKWGQPVVVDNKTGASGNIGTGIAARAEAKEIRILGVARDKRVAAAPEVPTLIRTGHARLRGRSLVRPAGAGRHAARSDRALQHGVQ